MRYLLFIICFFYSISLFGQEKCECCSYYSIDRDEMYGDFFNPDIIKNKGVKDLEVSTIEKIRNDSILFLQAKFQFDKNGFVIIKKSYYAGNPQQIIEFSRDKNGLPTKIIRSYLDSLERVSTFYHSSTLDLTYDTYGQLIKTKERNFENKIVKDGLSNYTKYQYDNSKRQTEEYQFYYYDDKQPNSVHSTKTVYKNKNSQSITKIDDKPWMRIKSNYNDSNQLIKQVVYSLPDNKVIQERLYEYNNESQVINYISKLYSGITECADKGNFTETYYYNDSKLIERIIHEFDSVKCTMIFTYN